MSESAKMNMFCDVWISISIFNIYRVHLTLHVVCRIGNLYLFLKGRFEKTLHYCRDRDSNFMRDSRLYELTVSLCKYSINVALWKLYFHGLLGLLENFYVAVRSCSALSIEKQSMIILDPVLHVALSLKTNLKY